MISSTRSGEVLCGMRLGAEEGSSNPGAPSARHRASQRRAVRAVIPAASAASSTDQPLSIRSTSNCLLFGQVRALACNFIRFSLGLLALDTSSLQGDPDG